MIDTIVDFLNTIFSEEGIVALVLFIVLVILIIIAWALLMLVRQKNSDGATLNTQATVIAQLVKPIDDIVGKLANVAEAQMQTSTTQLRTVELLNGIDQRVNAMGVLLEGAVVAMQTTTTQRSDQMDELPRRVREEMAPDLERLPKTIQEALAPTITAFQTDLEAVIAKLEMTLTQRIETATERIPARTESLVQDELETLRSMIKQGFEDVLNAVQTITIKDDEPSEGT